MGVRLTKSLPHQPPIHPRMIAPTRPSHWSKGPLMPSIPPYSLKRLAPPISFTHPVRLDQIPTDKPHASSQLRGLASTFRASRLRQRMSRPLPFKGITTLLQLLPVLQRTPVKVVHRLLREDHLNRPIRLMDPAERDPRVTLLPPRPTRALLPPLRIQLAETPLRSGLDFLQSSSSLSRNNVNLGHSSCHFWCFHWVTSSKSFP